MTKMKRSVLNIAILSVLALLVAGCAMAATPAPQAAFDEGSFALDVEAEEMAMEAPAEPGRTAGGNYAPTERLIVRNASLDVVVSDTEAALEDINALVKELGGFIVTSNVYQYQEGLQASVTFRVPVDSLDVALARIRDLATEVRSETISGEDVTEEYVDLGSRLRHLEAIEDRLTDFLDEAEDTEAALAVFEQLREVQAEIEYVKGRRQYLEESAALSSVELRITPDELAQPIQVGGWRPGGTLKTSFQALIRVLQFLVDLLIRIVVLVIPVLIAIAIPIAVVVWIVRALVRRRRARKTQEQS
jgi:hypothetical protein